MNENPYEIIEETKDPILKQLRWNMAVGLQKIDNLKPSEYLIELIEDNIEGKKTTYEVEEALHHHYSNIDLNQTENRDQHECDISSARIAQLLNDGSFSFRPIALQHIHGYLFKDIFPHAGKIRTYNISKKEPILNNATATYSPFYQIEDTLKYDFNEEKEFDYSKLDKAGRIKRIAKFTSAIWQLHAFGDGNTRTTAVFIEKYLNTTGHNINNDLFKEHALYFRNALVRSNYRNDEKNITPTNEYLEKFFDNLLNEAKHELSNDEMFVDIK